MSAIYWKCGKGIAFLCRLSSFIQNHSQYLKCFICSLVQFRTDFLIFLVVEKTLLLLSQVFIQHNLKRKWTFLLPSNKPKRVSFGGQTFKSSFLFQSRPMEIDVTAVPSAVISIVLKSSFHFQLALGCWPVRKGLSCWVFCLCCCIIFSLG